ncbi:MAG: bacterial transcriptional activator domain-containing protein [Sedimentibacter saalensis]|uniref:bacterial transcriptional activator domain-containing protein n=1 Tax=Sedimentibacter saalensis TaxID=130788 RepID=UPI002B212EB9|nr:bacterial transcriptional activator domain-containing protein [Sedimentibacter saalensis]MEA5095452.1 bacterial transcriptional activator domain-containing protein [Sedimentibacter saalensis]
MKLYINTLGEFDIKANGQSMLKESSRTYRIYKLFEYFLTFRNKKLLPDTIIDNLLSESDSDDPKNMLRTQIFRLRKIIKMLLPDGIDVEKYININFTNGYYCLEIGEDTVVDIDEFERLILTGDAERAKNANNAIELYEEAISLYKGLYLSDNAYEVWLVPTRNYYQRLYLKTLFKLFELLKEKGEYEEIISVCEKALLSEPYEEEIHINLMEAMLNLGQSKAAMNHYEYALNLLEREMDAKPSNRFMDLQKKIRNNSHRNTDIDMSSIKMELEDAEDNGAMHCNFEYFKFLFNLQKRKSIRNNEYDYLCIINFNLRGFQNYDSLTSISRELVMLLKTTLRKGDAFTFWNDSQILIMLHDVRGDGVNIIEDRIESNIKSCLKINENEINIIFQPLVSENTLI